MLLALGAPAGFVALRSAIAARPPTLDWLAGELASQSATYAYLTLGTAMAFVVLGWILGRKEDLLESSSVTDPLTGLANRRHLHARVVGELARFARHGTPLALLLIDLDDLKSINDRRGHEAGDAALLAVARALRESCRKTDVPGRFGGDEFVVLASSTTAAEGLALAERLRGTLRAAAVKLDSPITVSIGVAGANRANSLRPETLYVAADQALYEAKAHGRDRVVLAPCPPLPAVGIVGAS